MDLLLVRHAEPQRNADTPADPGLSDLGVLQARTVADFLAGERVDALWTSGMARAGQTAAVIASALELPVAVDEDLAEFDVNAERYLHFEDSASGDLYDAFVAGDLSPWGTDAAAFRARVVAAMERIIEAHPKQRVVVVGHGGAINAYLGHLVGFEPLIFHIPTYTGISRVLAGSNGMRSIVSVNETSHLRNLQRD
jgi:probable phosphoglycerate mutase